MEQEKEDITQRIPSTPEGMAVAYISLIVMAILPIFFGSIRSVKHHKRQTVLHRESGEVPECMTQKDAALFPFVASAALFGFYVFFQIFSKEYINILLTAYFFVLGVLALCHLTSPVVRSLVPTAIPNHVYTINLLRTKSDDVEEEVFDYQFSVHDIVCLICCSLVGVWYILKKHWIINNLFGIAFAINGVELLNLNNIVTGVILLSGLFVYDVFWVFGTNVMVTVAKSFEVPIKLVFPQDILENGLMGTNFAMLGLGDIVIPGIFIALLLRFDNSLKRNSRLYFYSTFFAYFLGLVATICVMHVFKHAQPALLYLVPACIITPLIVAGVKREMPLLMKYEDHPGLEGPPQNVDYYPTAKVQSKSKKDK